MPICLVLVCIIALCTSSYAARGENQTVPIYPYLPLSTPALELPFSLPFAQGPAERRRYLQGENEHHPLNEKHSRHRSVLVGPENFDSATPQQSKHTTPLRR